MTAKKFILLIVLTAAVPSAGAVVSANFQFDDDIDISNEDWKYLAPQPIFYRLFDEIQFTHQAGWIRLENQLESEILSIEATYLDVNPVGSMWWCGEGTLRSGPVCYGTNVD